MKSTGARRPARPTLGAARPWITAGCATAQWKARFARRYPPPLEPPLANRAFSSFCGGLNPGRLTHPAKRNIIRSIRGSTRPMAEIKSEPRPASNRNRWPASYWNARPASSESALYALDRYQEALEAFGRLIFQSCRSRLYGAAALIALGRPREARRLAEEAVAVNANLRPLVS